MRKLLVLLGLIGLGGLGYVAAKRLMAGETVGYTTATEPDAADARAAYTAPVPPAAETQVETPAETPLEAPAEEPAPNYVAEGVAPVTPEGVAEAVDGAEPEPGPHGPGSAAALEDGASPHPSYTIKGNVGSLKYHPEDSPYYARTVAEVWFKDEESAQAAGFVHWRTKPVD